MSSTHTKLIGTCALCGAQITKADANRHLAACLTQHQSATAVKGYHLMAEGADAPQYWMHFYARATATLRDVDEYLRRAWLECCGHMSAFRIGGTDYEISDSPRGWVRKDRMGIDTELQYVLSPGLEFSYEYDFGSTTELGLQVVGELAHPPRGRGVQLLALNDPPQYECSVCHKPAQVVDAGSEELYCKACGRKHAEDVDMLLPLVNSPRTGVCAYTGPVIRVKKSAAGAHQTA